MHNEIISIIIPCYNVEKYISKCIKSIIEQTYSNLEIILVDDYSTDNTYEILKEHSKKDNRIKLLKNIENNGAAYSRNKGLSVATGKYISFIDSDDYIDKIFYEKMLDKIIKNNADISICDIKTVYENNNQTIINKCYDGDKFDSISILKSGFVASSGNKLFKKEIIEKYKYPEGIINEDIPVIVPAILETDKIEYVDNVYYYYFQRNTSVQNSKFSSKKFDVVKSLDLTLERIKNSSKYDQIKDILIYNQIITFLIYEIVKIRKFSYRRKALLEYYDKTKKYDIVNNLTFKEIINQNNKMHQIYYKSIVKNFSNKRIFWVSLIIGVHNLFTIIKHN